MGRRPFSPEFKQEAVRLVIEQKRSATAVARELGIAQSSLSAWVRQAEAGPAAAVLSDPQNLGLRGACVHMGIQLTPRRLSDTFG